MNRLLPLLLAVCACGSADAAQPGVYVDDTLVADLATRFDQVQECADLPAGSFEDLAVVMMPQRFPCPYYSGICSGEFVPPNTIRIGTPYDWKHEVVHYLLYVNTRGADPGHESELFWRCG